jgi:uncharacterized SAM-binding protein YcdF (DUF218 family)
LNPKTARRRLPHALGALARALLLLLVLALLGFAFLAWQVDRLGREDLARPADAIVVLGARVNADGSPGSDLTSRTYHAVDLWKQGIAPNIICTGGFRNEPLSAASVCKRFATSLGVPGERVYLADGSTSTIEDAQVTQQVMARQGWRNAVLVSHPLHLFRARWLFRREGIDAVTSPTTTDTQRIFPPLRAWYDLREAGGIIVTALDAWSIIPRQWVAKLQTWAYVLP